MATHLLADQVLEFGREPVPGSPAPLRSCITALIRCPRSSSCSPTTIASFTSLWVRSTSSISAGPILCPDDMIRSSFRPM